MCAVNFNQLHLRNAGPMKTAVRLSRGFFMIAEQDEAVGMLGLNDPPTSRGNGARVPEQTDTVTFVQRPSRGPGARKLRKRK